MHVESPSRLAAFLDQVSGPAKKDDSCAKGDARACLDLADPARPVDVGIVLSDGADGEATGFSVRSLDAFRAAAAKDFDLKEPRRGRVELVAKKPSDKNEKKPVVCDVTDADGPSHRVVCGEPRGVERLGAWLRTSPTPASREGLARVEIYRAPLVAAADKRWPDDASRDTRALAHDFDGATLTLTGGDGADAMVDLNVDARMRESHSSWTRALLAPAGSAAMPDTFARLNTDSTAALYVPGGGPFAALFDWFGFQEDELRAVLGRPMACGFVVDLDDGRAALASARRASSKTRDKANAELESALSGHAVCGVQEPVKAAEKLARKLVQLAPASGDRYAVRPATRLGLPAGSFLVETTHASTPTKSAGATQPKPSAPRTDTTLAIPDGDTTWLVMADGANDVARAARIGKRVLGRPKAAAPAARPGTLADGYVTTLLGAFFWDLAMHSYDPIEKTLASAASPQRLHVALTQQIAGSGGTLSLRLSTPASALPTFGVRASALALPIGLFAAAFFLADDAPKAKP